MGEESVGEESRGKLAALWSTVTYDPWLFAAIVVVSLSTAALEGLSLGFLLPLVEGTGGGGLDAVGNSGILDVFRRAYAFVGVPFTLEFVLAGTALALACRLGASVLGRWLSERLVANYVRDLRVSLFSGILRAEQSYLDGRGPEELLNVVVTEATYPANVLDSLVGIAKRLAFVLVYLGLMLTIAPALTFGALVVLGGITLVVRFVVRPAYVTGDRLADANEELQRVASAGVAGATDIKLAGATRAFTTRYRRAAADHADASVLLERNESVVGGLHSTLSMTVVLVVVYLAVTRPTTSIGAVGVFLFALLRLAPALSGLHGDAYYIDSQLPHVRRVRETRAELDDAREDPANGDADVDGFDGVECRDVSFSYPDGTVALEDVSLSVRSGEFVAVVGASGAGKSTLVDLLARLHTPSDGEIRGDGVDAASVSRTEWRSHVAVVRQDPFVFDDSLRENVRLGAPDASDESVERACELARVTDFIDDLPEGYDTLLGSDGLRLSGGQRQRVALARALLSDADVLVLDEATSNLDRATEATFLRALREERREKATLVVTHRLDAVASADRIYVIDGGRVVERGTHDELVDRDGVYAGLVNAHRRPVTTDGGE